MSRSFAISANGTEERAKGEWQIGLTPRTVTEMVDRLDYESEPEPEPEAREEMGRKKSQGKTIRFAGV